MKLTVEMHRVTAIVVAAAMLLTIMAPAVSRAGTPTDDLRQIEYKYYFRGKYQQAIEALRTYLARVDIPAAETTRAREFLAASYVLAGAPEMGKEVFTRIIVQDPGYAGPDPGLFKLEVVDVYAKARSDYAALAIKSVPESAPVTDTNAALAQSPGDDEQKPIYKKWWLYAGVAAVAIAVGAAVGGGGDESNPRTSGTVVVGVVVK